MNCKVVTERLRKWALLILVVCCLRNALASDSVADERDWLFSRQIGLYGYLLRSAEIAPPLRTKFLEGLHTFAFEYWLLCQKNVAEASPRRRAQLRDMIHRNGKNAKYFSDPACYLPFFENGRLAPSVAVQSVRGLDARVSQAEYAAMVRGFQESFFDATNAFPLKPVPSVSEMMTGETEAHVELAKWLKLGNWRMLGFERLPDSLQENPILAFRMLTTAGKRYCLMAFLRMCEENATLVGKLPKSLLDDLAGDSPDSRALRASLADAQKRCVGGFMRDWFRGTPEEASAIKALEQHGFIRKNW